MKDNEFSGNRSEILCFYILLSVQQSSHIVVTVIQSHFSSAQEHHNKSNFNVTATTNILITACQLMQLVHFLQFLHRPSQS